MMKEPLWLNVYKAILAVCCMLQPLGCMLHQTDIVVRHAFFG